MKQLVLKSGKYLLLMILAMLMNVSCDKIDSQVPEVPVSFTINLSIYNQLVNPGSSVYFGGVGYGGIIVSHYVQGEYYAFDATCTNELSQTCHLEPDGLLAVCPCCESQFSLFYSAAPISGPASAPLKQYNVAKVNDFTLRIYN